MQVLFVKRQDVFMYTFVYLIRMPSTHTATHRAGGNDWRMAKSADNGPRAKQSDTTHITATHTPANQK